MEHYLERLPGVLRRLVMPHLGSEFGAFAELYRYLRHGAELAERHMHAQAKSPAVPAPRGGSRGGESRPLPHVSAPPRLDRNPTLFKLFDRPMPKGANHATL